MASVFEGVILEELGKVGDFGIRKAGISFADIEEPFAIADRESVIGKDFVAFAVAEFHGGDDDVERDIGPLEFEPIATATARSVGRVGGFGDDAFVASSESVLEGLLNSFGRRAFGEVRVAQRRGSVLQQRLEPRLAVKKSLVENKHAVLVEQIESDEDDGNVGLNE